MARVGEKTPAHLLLPGLEALPPPFQGADDGQRAAGQAALEEAQGEAHGPPLSLLQGLGPVHLLPHIGGYGRVEGHLLGGKGVGHGVGPALGEEGGAVKAHQVFLLPP